MELFDAVILGFVQGATSFLPISSSGHVLLVKQWLSVSTANALAYEFTVQFAAVFALLFYFASDLWVLVQAVLRKLGRLPVNEKDLTLAYALIVGTIPAVLLGLSFETFVGKYFQNVGVVAALLGIASLFFMYVEWRYYLRPSHNPVTIRGGFWVGCFQAMSILPGFSRTGATIAGGMLLGLSRYEAARFSFILAIPIAIGMGSKKLIELLQIGGSVDWVPIVTGGAAAGVTAFVTIHFFLKYLKRHTLWPFIWYGVILSAFVGYISFIS